MIEYLLDKCCVDCGESRVELLEFDHIRGNKILRVSKMVYEYLWPAVLEEIGKCEIVCVNCHRLRTESRRRSYRYRFFVLNEGGNEKKDLVLSFLRKAKCVDCEISNGILLDFDHLDPDAKTAKMSDMIRRCNYTINLMKDEMKKCEIRCANCHRIKTNKQFGYYKSGV